MSRAAPTRRAENTADVEEGSPVVVSREDGDDIRGIVIEKTTYPEIDGAEDRIVVKRKDEPPLNVAASRATVVTGTTATVIEDLVGDVKDE